MIFSKRIKEARLAKGYTQEDLGKLIGVSKVSVCSYELGKKMPSVQTLKNIIRELDVDPNYLLGNEINIVFDNETGYSVKMSKEDVDIIKELKKHPNIYIKLIENPERTVELINRQIINYL